MAGAGVGRVGTIATGVVGILVADDGTIQSVNFDGDIVTGAPGTSGFAIGGPSGSAIFNDVSMRGQLEMEPITQGGPGNIWWNDGGANNAAIYEDTGLKAMIVRGQFDNPNVGSQGSNAQITIWPSSFNRGAVAIGGWGSTTGSDPNRSFTQLSGSGIYVMPLDRAVGTAFVIPNGGLIAIGTQSPPGNDPTQMVFSQQGSPGQYYYEEYAISGAASFTSGTLSPIVGTNSQALTLIKAMSDYTPSPMNTATGVWTCPCDGTYEMTLVVFFNLGLASPGARFVLAFTDGAGNRLLYRDVMSMGFNDTLSGKKFITAGTTVTAGIDQVSGSTHTISTSAGLTSFVSFKRDL
jgi:hypothetical protein